MRPHLRQLTNLIAGNAASRSPSAQQVVNSKPVETANPTSFAAAKSYADMMAAHILSAPLVPLRPPAPGRGLRTPAIRPA